MKSRFRDTKPSDRPTRGSSHENPHPRPGRRVGRAALGLRREHPCFECGRCCSSQGTPPFGDSAAYDALPEELKWGEEHHDRYDAGLPCLWYDESSRKCRHHDLRPEICRDFDVAGPACNEFRAESPRLRRIGLAVVYT